MKLGICANSTSQGGAESFTKTLAQVSQAVVFAPSSQSYANQIDVDFGPKISKKNFLQLIRVPQVEKTLVSLAHQEKLHWLLAQFKLEQLALGKKDQYQFKRIYFEHGPLTGWYRFLPGITKAFRKAELVCAGSMGTANQIQSIIGKTVHVIPYPLDLPLKRPEPSSEISQLKSKTRIALWADQTHRNRGLEELLSAWTKNTNPNWQLWILGNHRPRNIAGVKFLGFRKDFLEILAAADVFINSSYASGEAMPLRLCQAMVMGIPIVSQTGPFSQELFHIPSRTWTMPSPPWGSEKSPRAQCYLIPRCRGSGLVKELHQAFGDFDSLPARENCYAEGHLYYSPKTFWSRLSSLMSSR